MGPSSPEESSFPEDQYRPSARSIAGESLQGLEKQHTFEMEGPEKPWCGEQEIGK